MKINVASMKNISGNQLVISNFTKKEIKQEHKKYFKNISVVEFHDNREKNNIKFNQNIIDDEGMINWKKFESTYLQENRLLKFWVREIQNAIVYPPYGIVRVGSTFIKDTIREAKMLQNLLGNVSLDEVNKLLDNPDYELDASIPNPVVHIETPAFILGNGLFENYFNWTLRYLSKISTYQNSAINKLIIPGSTIKYIHESLEFFGVKEDSLIFLNEITNFKQLVLSSPMALGRYELSPQMCLNLREHASVKHLHSTEKLNKLYIPRRNVKIRKISNAHETDDFFRQHGFDVFDNSEHSISEQVEKFKNAEIIVSAHGAGLTNIVYCRPNTLVIEIVPIGYDQGVTSYRSLSDLFDLKYVQLFAEETKLDPKGNRCNSDISLNLEELYAVIQDIQKLANLVAYPTSSLSNIPIS